MNVSHLLTHLEDNGIYLTLKYEDLKISSFNKKLSQTEINLIKENKSGILAHLRGGLNEVKDSRRNVDFECNVQDGQSIGLSPSEFENVIQVFLILRRIQRRSGYLESRKAA